MNTKESLLKELQLEPHVEGGYLVRAYSSPQIITIRKEDGSHMDKFLMTCAYYMLTVDSPINHFNRNGTNIVHYYHLGLPIRYHVITPEGQCSSTVLGPNISAGEKLQFMVPARCWKAAELVLQDDCPLDYGLISEGMAPGFDYADWSLATTEVIQTLIPQEWENYKHFISDKQ